MPRTFNNKTRYRGTAGRLIQGGETTPSSVSTPDGGGRRHDNSPSSASHDPEYDFLDDSQGVDRVVEIARLKSPKQSGRVSSPSNKHFTGVRSQKMSAEASTECTSSPAKQQQREKDGSFRELQAKVEELQKALKEHQAETKAALEEKNSQIQIVSRDLDEVREQREALENRLVRVESSSLTVTRENETLRKQLAEQKQAAEEIAKDMAACLPTPETTAADSKKDKEQSDDSQLANIVQEQQKMMRALEERLTASDTLIQQLQYGMRQQKQSFVLGQRQMKNDLQSIKRQLAEKDSRIVKQEAYIRQSQKDAKKLKSLLIQVNRTIIERPLEIAAKKRKIEDHKEEIAQPWRKSPKNASSGEGVVAWLNNF